MTGARSDLREIVGPWLPGFAVPDATRRVIVGCSGGADSLALLALAVAAGLDVTAVHVDHRLRVGSAGEASIVRGAARDLGVAAEPVAVTLRHGPALEARARDARLGALERACAARGADAVLLGHTGDDQAETVLLNLLRGSALPGLAGIPPARPGVVHPILGLRRADTVEICARLGWRPVHDPMNDDPSFRRVWLRREVIPFLEAGTGRDLRQLWARQAAVVREESDYLDDLAGLRLEAFGSAAGAPSLDAEALAVPAALARRVVRLWWGPVPPTLAEVDAVLGVAAGERSAADFAGGARVERAGGVLHRVGATGTAPPAPEPFDVPVPGVARSAGLEIETWIERGTPDRWPDGAWTCVLDADAVGERAMVRPATRGERFRPLGMSAAKTVTSVLAEAGVPPARRSGALLLADAAGTPLWLVGYRVGASARVTPATRRYLWVRASRESTTAAQPLGVPEQDG